MKINKFPFRSNGQSPDDSTEEQDSDVKSLPEILSGKLVRRPGAVSPTHKDSQAMVSSSSSQDQDQTMPLSQRIDTWKKDLIARKDDLLQKDRFPLILGSAL